MTTFLVGVLGALLVIQRPALPTPGTSFVVERGRAGVFELGMDVDRVQAIVGQTHTRLVADYPEGMFTPWLEIAVDPAPGVALKARISDGPCGLPSIDGIVVRDPRYKTADGIGVGSTLADVQRRHPGAAITNLSADGFPVVVGVEPGVSIIFEGAETSVPTARVTGLWVVPDPGVRARRCPRDEDAARVLQAALDALRQSRETGDGVPVVGVAETRATEVVVPAPFVADFRGRNSGTGTLPMLDGLAAVVSTAVLDRMAPLSGPNRVTRVQFSMPGFSAGRAVVVVSVQCGNLCGKAWMILLEFRDGRWQATEFRLLAVS